MEKFSNHWKAVAKHKHQRGLVNQGSPFPLNFCSLGFKTFRHFYNSKWEVVHWLVTYYFRVVSIWPLKQENACIKQRRKESLFCTQTTPEGMYQDEILLPFLTSSRYKVYAPIHPPSTSSWNGLLPNNTNQVSRIIVFYSHVLFLEFVFYKLIKSDYDNKYILVGTQRWLACTVSICKTLWPLNKNIYFLEINGQAMVCLVSEWR